MTVAPILVLVAEAATLGFFLIYGVALASGVREDWRAGRKLVLDATGRALIAAAKYGFVIGIVALTVSSLIAGFAS